MLNGPPTGAAVPVAVKATGLPLMPLPATVAVSVFVPAAGPSDHDPRVAMPFTFVVTVAPVTEPPPPATASTFRIPSTTPTDDDLFGPPTDQAPAEEATPPADEKNDEKKAEDDDLFGKSQAILETPGGLASLELRRWVDDTGTYSCRGRLVRVLDGKVQLLKDTGRTTTVPMNRLSRADFQFVTRQASAQRAEAISKTAQVSTGWSN